MIVLVVAKAPVPGLAKTRLAPAFGAEGAADLAAAALLDTLDAAQDAAGALGTRPVVALTGGVSAGARAPEIARALAGCRVVPQRGEDFAQRLTAAHADAARSSDPSSSGGVIQIGMDTPQVDAGLLLACARGLGEADAVLGPAEDGGWWVLALREPGGAQALTDVPMSTPRTHELTRAALVARGLSVAPVRALRDVDTVEDALAVAALAPSTRFARAVTSRAVSVQTSERQLRPEPAG